MNITLRVGMPVDQSGANEVFGLWLFESEQVFSAPLSCGDATNNPIPDGRVKGYVQIAVCVDTSKTKPAEAPQRSTPETDALHAKQGLTHAQYRDFARRLERERDEAREENEAMREAIKDAHEALAELVNLGSLELPQRRDSALLAGSSTLTKLKPFLKP